VETEQRWDRFNGSRKRRERSEVWGNTGIMKTRRERVRSVCEGGFGDVHGTLTVSPDTVDELRWRALFGTRRSARCPAPLLNPRSFHSRRQFLLPAEASSGPGKGLRGLDLGRQDLRSDWH
jgi:hypothetical protein